VETGKLKKFAQRARRELIEQVSARLGQVLAENSLARREQPEAVRRLQKEIDAHGEAEVIERAAYTWFNRFSALRFMDVNHYNRVGVVSPAEGQTQPEILAEAKSGHVNEAMAPKATRDRVLALLGGQETSRDPQRDAYRLLLVAACNHWHEAMPFLFERIADWTELLMPDDLLSEGAVLGPLREAMTVEACQDVEIIGWLYQFYISEKKDQVFARPKNKKIEPENIPAATQLFTPHWIVRYLVENSLGRLWMLNRPNSRFKERMEYYIESVEEEPRINTNEHESKENISVDSCSLVVQTPEEIKVCDPACGSGHMLTYAFDLLYAIYEEEGYDATEIPALILTHNLTGVEIDDRAGALAAFALAMKAAAKLGRRRFLRMEVKPDIVVLQNVSFTPAEMQDVAAVVGKDLFTDELRETLGQFEQAKNFGSLIVPKLRDPAEALRVVEARDFGGDLLLKEVKARVIAVLRMAEALSPKYHVVVANPPYMARKGMNAALQAFAKTHYPDSRTDLFAMFMERSLKMARLRGMMAMINMQSWMFLSSFEKLRAKLLAKYSIKSLAHLGERAFDTIGGAVVSTTAFVFEKQARPNFRADYFRLTEGRSEQEKARQFLEAVRDPAASARYRATTSELSAIQGRPIAYWVSAKIRQAFAVYPPLMKRCKALTGMRTGDNERFLRIWHEIDRSKLGIRTQTFSEKWFPYNKGGDYRKWFGNAELVVNWEHDGDEIKELTRANYPELGENLSWKITNEDKYFKTGITWGGLTSTEIAFRWSDYGALFDSNKGAMMFPPRKAGLSVIGFLNSQVAQIMANAINPTLSTQNSDLNILPFGVRTIGHACDHAKKVSGRLIATSKSDWDAYETSWDFTTVPLLSPEHRAATLEATYTRLRAHWQGMTDEMQRLEEENNRIFIDAYGLQDELTPEVPIEEITLTCNPAYRYGVKGSEEDREARLRADTMAEFLSYAVGCMFGRYSLDKPGLILANQGETVEDYFKKLREPRMDTNGHEGKEKNNIRVDSCSLVVQPSFLPDDDNVIPILDAAWFTDGIVERFREFLKVTFGTEHYEENLGFIEDALGKDIRKYFLNDFYKDHVRRYKKRPIYWLFSSPKGSFNALIYMHRYRSDTVSVILNDYLREFRTKLEVRLANLEEVEASTDASKRDKTAAVKELNKIRSTLDELENWERKVLLPLAEKKIEIDLDDGVKANYPKFGDALKKIPGLG